MTKHELIDAVAEQAGLTKRDAASAVDAALAVIESTLRNGESVTFTGFGKFHVTWRAARQGVNPRTGERIQIAAVHVPKFSPGSVLKNAVNVRSEAEGWTGAAEAESADAYYDEDPAVMAADSEGEPDEPWRRRS